MTNHAREDAPSQARGGLRWLRPPRHPDEEDTRVARVVHILGIGMAIAILPTIFRAPRDTMVVLCGELVLVLGCLALNHAGALRLASRLLVLSAILLAASLQFASRHGVHDTAVLIYPSTIVAAGALFDRRWFIPLTGLAMLAYAVQYSLELSGTVTYSQSQYTSFRLLLDAEIILGATALSVGILMSGLRESMQRSRAALASLHESEDTYRTLFEAVNDAIFILDANDASIVDANRRARELFGYAITEVRGLALTALFPSQPEDSGRDALARFTQAKAGLPQSYECPMQARDARVFWSEVSMLSTYLGKQQRVLVSLRDIDERRRLAEERKVLEQQLYQAQRLESIGRLAGGVAHDFNNLLTCIGVNAGMCLASLPPRHEITGNLDEIRHATRRAAELTGQLLAFSRKQPIEPRTLDLAKLLESLPRMLARLLGEKIALHTEVAPKLGAIHADPGQIEQILINLAVNARDAMPAGGRLSIIAENITIDEAICASLPMASVGRFVRLRVADTGVGMNAEVLSRIFEPFFTTKPAGQGTGLGLAMVFGAVQQNKGFLDVRSQPGSGTTFDVYLPVHDGAVTSSGDHRQAALSGGSERIMLVEDDPAVRHVSEHILTQLGYHVVSCASAEEAITAFGERPTSIDLLVTDVILPGLDGRALAERLKSTQPTLKVLFCSGYTADIIARHGMIDPGLAFLPKPFTADGFARKIRSVLDNPPEPMDGEATA